MCRPDRMQCPDGDTGVTIKKNPAPTRFLCFLFCFLFFCQAHHCWVFIQKHSSIITIFLLLTHSQIPLILITCLVKTFPPLCKRQMVNKMATHLPSDADEYCVDFVGFVLCVCRFPLYQGQIVPWGLLSTCLLTRNSIPLKK